MDTTLVIVTILSMGMAAALSAIVWRLLRDERLRSEARITALTEASRVAPSASRAPVARPRAAADATPRRVLPPEATALPPETKVLPPGTKVPPPEGGSYRETSPANEPAAPAFRRNGADDLPLHGSDAPVATSALFAEPAQSSPWGNRLAVMAGIAMFGAAIVLFALTAAKSRSAAPAPVQAAAAPAAAEPSAPGLELLSLRDGREADTLTITGMVQNARTGAPLSNVAVTAYAFDDKGSFLASGRALIDVTSLAPGDESPFLVTVPVTGTVARYRIGFRSEDGRVIAHVDKRQQAPMASLRQPNG